MHPFIQMMKFPPTKKLFAGAAVSSIEILTFGQQGIPLSSSPTVGKVLHPLLYLLAERSVVAVR